MNSTMKNDLYHLYKFYKRYWFNRIFESKANKSSTNYELKLIKVFDKLIPFINKIFVNNSLTMRGSMTVVSKPTKIIYNRGVNFKVFMEFLTEYKSAARILSKLDRCYNTADECVKIVEISGHEYISIKTNPQFSKMMRQVLLRYNANPKCVELSESVKDMEVSLEIKGEEK